MKNLVITLLIFCVMVSGCFISCKQDPLPAFRLSQDFKDYVVFNTGSYWVYSNETGELDSVHLYQQSIEFIENGRVYNFNYDLLKQNLSSSYFKDKLFGSSATERFIGDSICHLYFEVYTSNFDLVNTQFITNVNPGPILEMTDNSKVQFIGELATYNIDNNVFNNVRVFENHVFTDARLPRKIFYAKGIGVIRKELFNGQVWNLKRYFINK